MLNDNNALVQAIAGFVALLTPTQKQAAIALAEIVTLALSDAPPPVPVASFTHTLDGLNATFTDTSTGGHSRVWSFGDGLTSTAQHPTHVYTTAGTYCVTLTIANEEGEMSAATLLLTVLGGGVVGETTSITSGLQAWWKFRQLTGAAAVVNDGTTGSADDLTPDDTGVTAQNSGPNGRLATAASSGTTFWEGDTTSSLLQSTDYTVALLFYKDTGMGILAADASGAGTATNVVYVEEPADLELVSITHYGTTDASQRMLLNAGWTGAFVVHDGTTKTTAIYRENGGVVQESSDYTPTAGVGTRNTTPAAFTVGALVDGSSKFLDDIDDIRVYNRKLSEADMNAIVTEWGY